MRLLVIIVNYCTPDLTIECLRSLESEIAEIPGARVAVVDNASADSSADRIEAAIAMEQWEGWVSLCRAPRNGGFAYGNNLAIRRVMEGEDPPEFIHLLNPDTVIRSGALQRLLAFMDARPRAGIAGSLLETPDGGVHPNAFRFYSIGSEFEGAVSLRVVSRLLARWRIAIPLSGGSQEVDWVCGASMMIRRDVFATAGYFDEDYFLYYEEADFCLQANRQGWECWYVPESRVVHVLSAASQVLRGEERRAPYWFESRRHYFCKNHGAPIAFGANVVWVLGFSFWKIRCFIQRRPAHSPPHMLRDFLRFSFIDRKKRIPRGSDS